ncbi:M23 family metallopeptidase [Aeromicrobium wangtongii]|uniref:M23 family metallopeptidase n=1 Tax=Aeromicrobium wangtongii TaxID=2969247 RepID=A0ABY5M8V1_9ACTN|nr:M23 family metallopeptidase [Aeromicrobium wangtongii]MCD9198883.1 M23 family metallopeptidase [Aeromicrobium wangtongii]MCL3819792.1 M23 family metallopeptidase [Aeromicrobium wangtongii]UUP13078.1 M23 family metallopeptidase [Aeromicrobium wangtongii]
MAGAFALILAAFGSAVAGSGSDGNTLSADKYQTISQSYTGPEQTTVDVSRSFDRATLDRQAKMQAEQTQAAQAELAQQVGKAADELKQNTWVIPVTGYHLSARFGQRSGLWSTVHTGLDFAGPSGSTIVSVAAGTVVSAGYEGAYGNRTVIRLNDGTGTEIWYCHQSRFAVSVGDNVGPGDVIGYTGSTGNVTGPHLHLEVHPAGGPAVDPVAALAAHNVTP